MYIYMRMWSSRYAYTRAHAHAHTHTHAHAHTHTHKHIHIHIHIHMRIFFTPNHKWLYRALAVAMFTEVLERDHQQPITLLEWRHNGLDSVSNHQPRECLFDRLFRRRSKKTSKLRVTGLYEGNSPGIGEFRTQMASYAKNVSIWWRHHDRIICFLVSMPESNVTRLVDQHRKWLTSSSVVIVFLLWMHWGKSEMVAILQTKFSNSFSLVKNVVFVLWFHLNPFNKQALKSWAGNNPLFDSMAV